MSEGRAGLFSIILLPGENSDASTRASVEGQTVDTWELIECGSADRVSDVNDAIARASGEFVAFVDGGDTLPPAALERALELISRSESVDIVYTDEDGTNDDGSSSGPFFKPDWSPDRLLGHNYLGRLVVLRRTLVEAVGRARAEVAEAWEYDLLLRTTTMARRIEHVAEVCYRRGPGTTDRQHPDRAEAARRALNNHLDRIGLAATAEPEIDGQTFRLRPRLVEEPLVSIIIPTGGAPRRQGGKTIDLVSNCVESIVEHSTYENYELVVVIDEDVGAGTRTRLAEVKARLRLVEYRQPFNFSHKINLGAVNSLGDYLVLLNDDTAVITPDWLESMLMFATHPQIGAVGALLRFGDRRFQHVGIVSVDGSPGHPYQLWPEDFPGYHDNVRVPSNYLAVTAACLMTRRSVFEAVGGFSQAFALNYNDVDFCLKLRHAGYRVVYSPEAELFHFESATRGRHPVATEELARLHRRWGKTLDRDPYYSPHFLPSADFLTLVVPDDRTAADLGVGPGSGSAT